MRFRWKLIVVGLLLTLALNLALYLFSRRLLDNLMQHLEKGEVVQILQSGRALLMRRIENLDATARDLAAREDSFALMTRSAADEARMRLEASAFANLGVDLAVYIDQNDNIIYSGYYDREHSRVMPVARELLREVCAHREGWMSSSPGGGGWSGLARLGGNICLIAAQPVRGGGVQGSEVGTLVLARILDQELVDEMREDGGHPYEFAEEIPELRERPPQKAYDNESQLFYLRLHSPTLLDGWFELPVAGAKHNVQLHVRYYRNIYLHGKSLQQSLLAGTALVSLVFCLLIYLSVDKALVAREELQRNAREFVELSNELKAILDGIAAPLILISQDRLVRWANKSGVALIGEADPVGHGKYLVDVPYTPLEEMEEDPVDSCFREAKVVEVQYRLREGLELLERAFPLKNEQGEVSSVILMRQDVTERVHLQRQAEQMDRLTSLGEVAAGIAHEINNPIGMLQVNLNLFGDLARDAAPYFERIATERELVLGGLPYDMLRERAPRILEEMREGCRSVRRLVEDLKGFARGEELSGFNWFEISDAVEAAVRLVQYSIYKGGNDLVLDMLMPMPRMYGARHRIEQVLVNLLLNAHHASAETSAPIMLHVDVDDEKKQLIIEVIDQGCGMPPEVLSRATDPFFTTRRNEGGTGLGLSLSTRIIKDHGGEMKIRSTAGTGTTVSLVLPIVSGSKVDDGKTDA